MWFLGNWFSYSYKLLNFKNYQDWVKINEIPQMILLNLMSSLVFTKIRKFHLIDESWRLGILFFKVLIRYAYPILWLRTDRKKERWSCWVFNISLFKRERGNKIFTNWASWNCYTFFSFSFCPLSIERKELSILCRKGCDLCQVHKIPQLLIQEMKDI